MLREIDERKLINAYGCFIYNSEDDISNDNLIKENLIKLLDWDINGDNGLGIYCGKFESIKRKDWIRLIDFIKENHHEIKRIAYLQKRKLDSIKIVNSVLESKEKHNVERFTDENYEVSGRGKKARSCIYNGKIYKSRQECMYKEGISKNELYKYLNETNQV